MNAPTIGRVVFLLDATGHLQQAAALAFASNAVCLATSRELAVGASKGGGAGARAEHPIATMHRLLHSKWKRRLLAWVILRMDVHFAGPDGLPAPFLQHYRSRFDNRLQPARELGGLGDFTFVVVERARALAACGEGRAGAGEDSKGRAAESKGRPAESKGSAGEEFARFRFICFREVEDALRFFSDWLAAQRRAPGPQQAMSLMEAGPSNAETPRKWIIDIDAKVADLRAAAILCWPEQGCTNADEAHLHHAVVQYARALSRGLHALGFTPRACNFALKCRHRRGAEGGYHKLSWHVTLCAMAPYAQLRAAMTIIHERLCPPELLAARDAKAEVPTGLMRSEWLMAYFSDTHIGANSKGQFMQALGSRKVVANVQVDPGESAFEFCGIFDAGSGMAVRAPSEIVRFAATSMSLCDPWCVPLQCGEEPGVGRRGKRPAPSAPEGAGGGKRQEQPPPQRGLARWDLLPQSDAPWMLPLLCDPATTTLKEIPSMANPEHMAYAVSNLLKSGRGDIVFYANVVRPRLCPRHIAYADDAHAIHRHGSNNMIAVCVREHNESSQLRKEGLEPPFSVHRLFTRCFSQKCMQHAVNGNPWVELKPQHCHRVRALCAKPAGGKG